MTVNHHLVMLKCLSRLSLVLALFSMLPAPRARAADTRVFEMRTYYAAPDKLDALQARFRDHTCKLFEKHGIANIGYWVPLENPENKLIYLLAYPSREAREKSWKSFFADPAWQAAYKASEVNGKLVAKVEQLFLQATDYSPLVKPDKVVLRDVALTGRLFKADGSTKPAKTTGGRVFELRTYPASPGNLGQLNARFRDHTLKLFEKHGMTNVGYWVPMKDQPGADDTLVYLLAHQSREAAKESFGAFGKDPDWQAARKASEEKAGGPLTVKGGVKSLFMNATDYSPLK